MVRDPCTARAGVRAAAAAVGAALVAAAAVVAVVVAAVVVAVVPGGVGGRRGGAGHRPPQRSHTPSTDGWSTCSRLDPLVSQCLMPYTQRTPANRAAASIVALSSANNERSGS